MSEQLLAGDYGQLANESLKTTNYNTARYESILAKCATVTLILSLGAR
jgi:hypothetical protein